MDSQRIQALLSELPRNPTAADLEPLAAELTSACAQCKQPRKSLALHLRYVKDVATTATLGVLENLVKEALERGSHTTPITTQLPSGSWLNVAEAARVLDVREKTLQDRLKDPAFRYLYGWPHWDGHQWRISSPAIAPGESVAHLDRLPQREPAAQVAMLPDWCTKQEPMNAGPDACPALP